MDILWAQTTGEEHMARIYTQQVMVAGRLRWQFGTPRHTAQGNDIMGAQYLGNQGRCTASSKGAMMQRIDWLIWVVAFSLAVAPGVIISMLPWLWPLH